MIACLDNGTGASLQSSDNVQDDSIFLIRDISVLVRTELEKEMATHSSVLAWRIPGMGSLVGCHLWGCTESDTTKAMQQQQQQQQQQLQQQSNAQSF